jgi:Pyruvate/2-oxoacid:ferredoxin oxidoreductase delta subunit
MPPSQKKLDRRDFLKISLIAASCPAMFTACGSREIRILARRNPGVTTAQLKIVEFYSRRSAIGPPPSQELLNFVVHLFPPEEAEIVQYLPLVKGGISRKISLQIKLPEEEVEAVLSRIADQKRAIIAFEEPGKPRQYGLMPIVPGTMELVMMEGKNDDWHRRYGQLFEDVYNTGYIRDILKKPIRAARYIPVQETINIIPAALPSDLLTDMLKEHTSFGLGVCQCRQAKAFSGHDCGLPTDTCLATGKLADFLVQRNIMRRVDRAEALESKLKANAAGLATMSMNVAFSEPVISCSCCGCCCVILRTLNQFNAPGLIASPHFIPIRDENKCLKCGLCQSKCPMGCHSLSEKGWAFRRERCIGCGVCASVCPARALVMDPVKNYQPPPINYKEFAWQMAPGYLNYVL